MRASISGDVMGARTSELPAYNARATRRSAPCAVASAQDGGRDLHLDTAVAQGIGGIGDRPPPAALPDHRHGLLPLPGPRPRARVRRPASGMICWVTGRGPSSATRGM